MKLADYKTQEERMAYLIINNCLSDDELCKLPLKEYTELVNKLSQLALDYLNKTYKTDGSVTHFNYTGQFLNDPQHFDVKNDFNLKEGDVVTFVDGKFVKYKPEINPESPAYPEIEPDTTYNVGARLHTELGNVEVVKSLSGPKTSCVNCIFYKHQHLCSGKKCSHIIFKAINE